MATQQQDSWWMETQGSGGLLQGLASVPVPQYLKIVVPLTVVFLLAFLLEYRAELGTARARLLTRETSVIHDAVRRVERELEIATGDLHFVVDLVAEGLDSDAPERLAALEQRALAFVRHRPNYLQIRVIDATGQELLRVENTPGAPPITAGGGPGDQSDRSYFSDTMRLEPGEVFVLPAELHVERGALEGAKVPPIRLATPIDDRAGQRRGIVILTAQGDRFLGAFKRNSDGTGTQHMIVNSDGYWVRHRPEVESGVVLEPRRSFQRTFPDVWPQLLANPQGWAESSEGFFYFDTVTPPPATSSPDTDAHALPAWVFISLVPRRLLDNIAVQIATPLLVIATPLYFMLLVIGCLLAGVLHRRKLAEAALRSLEAVKSAMMTAALDGIVVMDATGTTLEFNPSAQRIFGYTLDEARGKLVAELIIPPAHRETHRTGLAHYLETGEGRIIDKHVYKLTAIRKSGEEFPVELTVCPIMVMGKKFFYGFLRDLSEAGRRSVEAGP